jgi:RNA recognition motif-containing protein
MIMTNHNPTTATGAALIASDATTSSAIPINQAFLHSSASSTCSSVSSSSASSSSSTENNLKTSSDATITNQPQPQHQQAIIPTKLYVTNFPFTCSQRQIHDLFSRYGQVVECTLKKDYYAYILYTNSKSAQNAFKNANGVRMQGRKLTVHLATSKKSQSHLNNPNLSSLSEEASGADPTATAKIVHVRNFPETSSQQQIKEFFSTYGDIVECLILHDSYAFVHFKSPGDARQALQSTNNTQFMAQNLLVQYSRSKFKQQTTTTTAAAAPTTTTSIQAASSIQNDYYASGSSGSGNRRFNEAPQTEANFRSRSLNANNGNGTSGDMRSNSSSKVSRNLLGKTNTTTTNQIKKPARNYKTSFNSNKDQSEANDYDELEHMADNYSDENCGYEPSYHHQQQGLGNYKIIFF